MRAIKDMTVEEMAAEIRTYEFRKDAGYAFVSYSHRDREKVYPLVLAWMRAGYNIYIDLDFERHGSDSNWVDLMSSTLSRGMCRLGICFKSVNYTYSYAALLELLTMRGSIATERHNGKLFVDAIALEAVPAMNDIPNSRKQEYRDAFEQMSQGMGGRFLGQNKQERDTLYDGLRDWVSDSMTGRSADKMLRILDDSYVDGYQEFYRYIAKLIKDWFASQDLNGNDYFLSSSMEIRWARFDEVKVERVREPVGQELSAGPSNEGNAPETTKEEVAEEPAITGIPTEKRYQTLVLDAEPEDDEEAKNQDQPDEFEISNGVLVKYHGPGGDVVIPDGVTEIGASAFDHCKDLTGIHIPESVTKIGRCAFQWCGNLTKADLPKSVTEISESTFAFCENLNSILIPESVTQIGLHAFYMCKSLTKVDLPKGVTKIDAGAFTSCENLNSICIPEGVTDIEMFTFKDCIRLTWVMLPSTTEWIWNGAFQGCTHLTDVEILSKNCRIEKDAFAGCTALQQTPGSPAEEPGVTALPTEKLYETLVLDEEPDAEEAKGETASDDFEISDGVLVKYHGPGGIVAIPDGVRKIGRCAFDWRQDLIDVKFPPSVTEICSMAFQGCTSLTLFNIPSSVKKIERWAFQYCHGLTDVVIQSEDCVVESCAFDHCEHLGCTILDDVLIQYDGPGGHVTIPDGVRAIGKSAFEGCESLLSIQIPHSVTYIGPYAFLNCVNLSRVDADGMRRGLESIQEFAFCSCKKLYTVYLPDCLKEIGQDAFKDCPKLTIVARKKTCGFRYGKKQGIALRDRDRYIR